MKTRLVLVNMLLVLALLPAACSKPEPQQQAKTPEAKTQPVTAPEGHPHWSYEGEDGPSGWGKLSPEWTDCTEGKSQSPIDIEKTVKANLPALTADFKPAAIKIIHHEHIADVVNSGHSIQVNYTEGDELTIGDAKFALLQYHFHGPSEHTIGGKHYPMEMHMVHKSADGKLAVIGVMIEEGKHNSAFDPVWSNLPKARGTEYHLEHVKVDVNNLLPARKTTYRYDGSLTTPPCSEGVKWIIMTTPIQLSAKQVSAFRAIMTGNNRPVQLLNGRLVATDHLSETR